MKQAVLSHFDLPWIPITALILFVVCFAAYTYWTFKKMNRPFFEQASMIPLEDAVKATSSKGGN